MSEYIPPERIASQLKDAPFYIKEEDMDFYLIVENSYKALRELRMISLARRFETFEVVDYKVKLPCHYAIHNVVRVETSVTPSVDGVYQPNQVVFTVPEDGSSNYQLDTSHLDQIKKVIPHIIGEYVEYSKEGNCLTFRETDLVVGIEYNTLALDDRGYPLIPDNAEEAVVYYIAWIHYLGEFMASRLDGQRMSYFEQLKKQKMREARNDHRLSQNQLDRLMNTMTAFDRKRYGWTS